jgi:hypothetical protein
MASTPCNHLPPPLALIFRHSFLTFISSLLILGGLFVICDMLNSGDPVNLSRYGEAAAATAQTEKESIP